MGRHGGRDRGGLPRDEYDRKERELKAGRPRSHSASSIIEGRGPVPHHGRNHSGEPPEPLQANPYSHPRQVRRTRRGSHETHPWRKEDSNRLVPPTLNATNAGERDEKIAMTPLRRVGKPIANARTAR